MNRAQFWIAFLAIAVVRMFALNIQTQETLFAALAALMFVQLYTAYLRVKDIGWHGAMTLMLFVPFGIFFIGFKKAGSAKRFLAKPTDELSLKGESS